MDLLGDVVCSLLQPGDLPRDRPLLSEVLDRPGDWFGFGFWAPLSLWAPSGCSASSKGSGPLGLSVRGPTKGKLLECPSGMGWTIARQMFPRVMVLDSLLVSLVEVLLRLRLAALGHPIQRTLPTGGAGSKIGCSVTSCSGS